MAQDDYFYEIQLTNKQLVFYFMAGATGLILSFLAGVMVGRGVDGSAGEAQAVRVPTEERVVAEETPRPTPSAEDLTYAQRLEGDKVDDSLQKPVAGTAGSPSPLVVARPLATAESPRPVVPSSAPRATPSPRAAATVTPPPRTTPTPQPSPSTRVAAAPSPSPAVLGAGNFTIQVGAFKDRASAESLMARLKGKGFAAYVTSPQAEGLFNVRVGNFTDRADAERVAGRLRDDEKFKPFIVRSH